MLIFYVSSCHGKRHSLKICIHSLNQSIYAAFLLNCVAILDVYDSSVNTDKRSLPLSTFCFSRARQRIINVISKLDSLLESRVFRKGKSRAEKDSGGNGVTNKVGYNFK